MSVSNLLQRITSTYQAHANQANATQMKAYMKGQFDFIGIKAPTRKSLFRPLWKEHKALICDNWRHLVTALWQKNERDYQLLALDILIKCQKKMTNNDLIILEDLITTKSWWDTVDAIASNPVGHLLKDDKDFQLETIGRFMSSDNMWLIRTALIHQLKYKESTDEALLFSLIMETIGSKEFFINKASGWALRQYSKFNSASVADFIDVHRSKLSSLTIREGSKYLPVN